MSNLCTAQAFEADSLISEGKMDSSIILNTKLLFLISIYLQLSCYYIVESSENWQELTTSEAQDDKTTTSSWWFSLN